MFQKKAMELGTAIISTDEFKNFEAARKAFENNDEATKLMDQFDIKEKELNEAMTQKNIDGNAIARISAELEEIRSVASGNEVILALSKARSEFDKIMHQVNAIIMSYIDPQSLEVTCYGDCSSCSGCN